MYLDHVLSWSLSKLGKYLEIFIIHISVYKTPLDTMKTKGKTIFFSETEFLCLAWTGLKFIEICPLLLSQVMGLKACATQLQEPIFNVSNINMD